MLPEMCNGTVVSLLAIALGACASSRPPGPAPLAAMQHEALPFIEDDYGRALAEARASKKAIFVDAWAPW
jgi:hypothetical protein